MKSLLFRFFISLYIFLLSGFGQLNADAHLENTGDFGIKNTECTEQSNFSAVQNNHAYIIESDLSFSENDKINFSDNDNEDENDKFISLKKYFDNSNYFTALFYTHIPGYLREHVKKSLSIHKQVFNFPSQRWYILFRVIRI